MSDFTEVKTKKPSSWAAEDSSEDEAEAVPAPLEVEEEPSSSEVTIRLLLLPFLFTLCMMCQHTNALHPVPCSILTD
jgi:hypothetical protein